MIKLSQASTLLDPDATKWIFWLVVAEARRTLRRHRKTLMSQTIMIKLIGTVHIRRKGSRLLMRPKCSLSDFILFLVEVIIFVKRKWRINLDNLIMQSQPPTVQVGSRLGKRRLEVNHTQYIGLIRCRRCLHPGPAIEPNWPCVFVWMEVFNKLYILTLKSPVMTVCAS